MVRSCTKMPPCGTVDLPNDPLYPEWLLTLKPTALQRFQKSIFATLSQNPSISGSAGFLIQPSLILLQIALISHKYTDRYAKMTTYPHMLDSYALVGYTGSYPDQARNRNHEAVILGTYFLMTGIQTSYFAFCGSGFK